MYHNEPKLTKEISCGMEIYLMKKDYRRLRCIFKKSGEASHDEHKTSARKRPVEEDQQDPTQTFYQ